MRGSTRLLVLVALLAGALTAATAAPAAKGDFQARELSRGHAKASLKLPAGLQRAVRGQTTAKSASVLAASAVEPQLVAGEFPGFAYCGDDIAWIWPADAPSHDLTVTRTYVVYSASGDFTDAVVDPSPFLVIQAGSAWAIYDIEADEVVYEPINFADAWLELDLTDSTDHVLFINEITTIDGTTSNTEYALIETLGPTETGTPNVCQP